jgi:hypothetical protein
VANTVDVVDAAEVAEVAADAEVEIVMLKLNVEEI